MSLQEEGKEKLDAEELSFSGKESEGIEKEDEEDWAGP